MLHKSPLVRLVGKEIDPFDPQVGKTLHHLDLVIGMMPDHLDLAIERRIGSGKGRGEDGKEENREDSAHI
ncbi:MAG: hypothetical protein IJU90_05945 [Bacteroidales bacterium]|nr:hypothetical protein [Bacteroidales bacterium]